MADIASLRTQGEQLVQELDQVGSLLAHVENQTRDLVGMIAPVAERATEGASIAAERVNIAITANHQCTQALRNYLTGLTEN